MDQRDERPFGPGVGHAAWLRARAVLAQGGEGTGDHQRGTGAEVRNRRVEGVEHAAEIDAADVHPRLQGLVLRYRADTGVGHHDVDLAELRDAVGHRLPHGGLVADIGLDGEDPPAERLDLLHRLSLILLRRHRVADGVEGGEVVDRDDVRALAGELDGVTASLPACGTGDQCDLARNPTCHVVSPRRRGLTWTVTLRLPHVGEFVRDGACGCSPSTMSRASPSAARSATSARSRVTTRARPNPRTPVSSPWRL